MARKNQNHPGISRRDFLKLAGGGALFTMLTGSSLNRLVRSSPAGPGNSPLLSPASQTLPQVNIRLAATDGFISLPGRRFDPAQMGETGAANPLFVFGFRNVSAADQNASPQALIAKYKGKVQAPSPILGIDKDVDLYLTMTNLGLEMRPDLDDSHTVHWHGFRNPNAVFDGVPEVSLAVPPERDFPYFYRTRVEGTYMYHCHFEDAEHIQMGMNGVAFIRSLNGNTYDNDTGSTAFDREFTFMLNEIDTTPHDNLLAVQEFIWSDYKPNYWIINGRSYPDTVIRDQDLTNTDYSISDPFDPDIGYTQPISSLVQMNEGETGLLRIASLGYQQHTMQLLGIPMTIVGHDATYLGSQAYQTSSVYLGPGEARDALITAPAYNAALPGGTDGAGPYNVYWFRNRNANRLINGELSGLGGMLTQIRVYPAGTLPPQAAPNQTF